MTKAVVCGGKKFLEAFRGTQALKNEGVTYCESGIGCRAALSGAKTAKQLVIIGPELADVASINLVAAIHRDNPSVRIVLAVDDVTGSLSSRASVAGASKVICCSELPMMLSEAFSSSSPSLSALKRPMPNVLVFAGARGGVGKSSLALMSAVLAADEGLRVALVDLDLQFPSLAYTVGIEPSHTLFEYARNQGCFEEDASRPLSRMRCSAGGPANRVGSVTKRSNRTVHEYATPVREKVDLFDAGVMPEYDELFAPFACDIVAELCNDYDFVVVDTPSRWSEMHASLIDRSRLCVLVMDARLGAIHATITATELCARLGMPHAKFIYILNRYTTKRPITSMDAAVALKVPEVHTVHDGGREVEDLISVGCPEELVEMGNAIVPDIRHLLKAVLPILGAVVSTSKFDESETRIDENGKVRFSKRHERGGR